MEECRSNKTDIEEGASLTSQSKANLSQVHFKPPNHQSNNY